MARIICKLCGEIVLIEDGRTGHLKNVHDIDPYKGCVHDYFRYPWEAKDQTFNNILQHPLGTRKRAGETSDDGSVRRDRTMTEDGGTGRTAPPTGGIPAIERRKGGTKK